MAATFLATMSERHLLWPAGFKAAGVYAGIKSKATPDVGLLVCPGGATAAALFTTNKVVAAPVIVGQRHIASGRLRGVVVNSGNANACTGKQGMSDAIRMCQVAASSLNRATVTLPAINAGSPQEVDLRVQALLDLGRSRGYLTYVELNERLPDEMVSPDKLETLLMLIKQTGIKLIDEEGISTLAKNSAGRANLSGYRSNEFLPSSTGIIGHLLPMDKVEAGIAQAAAGLGESEEHALQFADAIMTTDLRRKLASAEVRVGRSVVRLAGVCKGSGMIGPRLSGKTGAKHATMLAYLTTDAQASPAFLRRTLAVAGDETFNAVTVDDHASTNDTVCLMASGAGGVRLDSARAQKAFAAALKDVCQSLAWQIAADGEGATKVVKIVVNGAANEKAAKAMARAIAVSPLVKCAMHGNDPNWGRIVSAAGMAGAPFEPDKCTLTLAGTVVFHRGTPAAFDAAAVSAALKQPEVTAELNCRMGKAAATVWTCDLSKEYVTINADYHT
ncbi:MAG: bifunctional ornithine acetyltransferase/N-acetylglutamate synthase [Tepidisphaeraceae bacterium]|jgi:glutamate N-acetyltransferase/amino-acid N-acetyltransferase